MGTGSNARTMSELDPDAWHTLRGGHDDESIRVYLGGVGESSRSPRPHGSRTWQRGSLDVRRRIGLLRPRFRAQVRQDAEAMRILVVEDEKDLTRALQRSLQEELFAMRSRFWTASKQETFMLSEVVYDAVVLDLMVPKRDGWLLLQNMRSAGSRAPVLVLTARHDELEGIGWGRAQPGRRWLCRESPSPPRSSRPGFAPSCAAPPAIPRRCMWPAMSRWTRRARRVYREGALVDLTSREYAILELMMGKAGRWSPAPAVSEQIYDEASDVFSNVPSDVHVAALRCQPPSIHTRRPRYIIDA